MFCKLLSLWTIALRLLISYKLNAPINGVLSLYPTLSSIKNEIFLVKRITRGVKLKLNSCNINN